MSAQQERAQETFTDALKAADKAVGALHAAIDELYQYEDFREICDGDSGLYAGQEAAEEGIALAERAWEKSKRHMIVPE